jgi:hypothetical protein
MTDMEIEAKVRSLAHMNIAELRDEWRRRYGAPPMFRSTDLLSRLLAWRIQADAFGGFDKRTIALIRAERVAPPRIALAKGTRLARVWRGMRHEVEVVDGGFRHDGTMYGSLSEVARIITGTRWNGLKFFGLREQP